MNLFAMHEVVDGQGSAIAADDDPNATTPPDHRVVELPTIPDHAANAFACFALDGTTITARPWLYEPKTGVWVPLYTAAAVVPAAPTIFVTAGLALARGARVFVQLTVNTGVTKLAWRYC
jgi:hypothetical protein